MARHWWPLASSARHLDEETILRHLDGELSKREDQRAEQHLRDCWQCRAAKERLKAAITAFMEERREHLSAAASSFPTKAPLQDVARETPGLRTRESARGLFLVFRRAPKASWIAAAAAVSLAAAGSWPPVRRSVMLIVTGDPAPARAALALPKMPLSFKELTPPPALPALPPRPVWASGKPETQVASSAGLDAAELAVYAALHNLGLCRGKAIEVARVPGEGIRVTGVADDAEQVEELRRSLAGTPGIEIQVVIPNLEAAVPEGKTAEPLLLEPRPPLLAEKLKHHFLRRWPAERAGREAAEYANRAVRFSSQAYSEAQALRTLLTVFTERRLSAMNPLERARFAHLADEHLRELEQCLIHLGGLLDQLDSKGSGAPQEPAQPLERLEDAGVSLERQAARLEYLAGGLFAGLDLDALDGEAAWNEMRFIHARMLSLIQTKGASWQAAWRGQAPEQSFSIQPTRREP